MPDKPGVYFFKDADNNILYIGKAKSLKNRLSSYFSSCDDKVIELLKQAVDIEVITTNNEIEALFLEAQLIKQHQPLFNRLLKEGNPYIYIHVSTIKTKLDTLNSSYVFYENSGERESGGTNSLFKNNTSSSNSKLPIISTTRTRSKKGEYFGPFLTKRDAQFVVEYLKKSLQLNICNKKIESGCLQYHIGICAGSCKKEFDEQFYRFRLNIARQILDNKYNQAIKDLDVEIKQSNKNLQFERSAHLTQYQTHLASIIETLKILKKTKFTNISNFKFDPTSASVNDAENDSNIALLSDLKKRLGLKKIPYTIDCFDISHMQSQSMVGSCVRFLNGKPDKKNFRHFGITSLVEQNDCAALAEIVARRYKKSENLPDLIIIDGGKGQLNATKHLASSAEIISISKGENRKIGLETIHFPDQEKTIDTDIHQAADRLLLEIRDYAHHFAISYHRKKQRIII